MTPRPLLAALVLVACAHGRATTERPKVPRPVGAEDLGLCDGGDATTDWLLRGCPKRALATLAGTGDAAQLVAARARAAVIADGLDETAPPGLLLDLDVPQWAWKLHGDPPRERVAFGTGVTADAPQAAAVLQALQLDARALAAAHARDAAVVPAVAVRELALRSFATVRCLDTVMAEQLDMLRREGAGLRRGLATELGVGAPTTGDELRIEAMSAAWSCELQSAFELAMSAAETEGRAGHRDASLAAAIDAIEIEVFPGGRADSFAVASFAPADSGQWAALAEAATDGAGALAERGALVTTRLAELDAAFAPDTRAPADEARVAIVRAIAALRLRGDAEAAKPEAERALALARTAARADRADYARMVLVLAHAELGALPEATAILDALDRSLTARGAEGARNRVARILREAGTLEIDRGRSELGVALVRLGRRLRPRLTSFTEKNATLTALPNVLLASGRIEEAVLELTVARELWAGERKTTEPGSWAVIDSQLAAMDADLRARLGDDGGIDPAAVMAELGLARAWAAVMRGDTDMLRRELAALDEEKRFGMLAAAPALGLCHALDAELAGYGKTLATMASSLQQGLAATTGSPDLAARAQLRAAAIEIERTVVPQLAACFAVTRQADRVRPLQALAEQLRRIGGQGQLGAIEQRMHAAFVAEASGRFANATKAYLALARDLVAGPGLAQGTAIGLGETAAPMYERAAMSALADDDADGAVAILEEARARDLRARRAGGSNDRQSPLAEVVALERAITAQQIRLRRLAQLAESTNDAKTRTILEHRRNGELTRIDELQRKRDAAVRETASHTSAAYRAAALAPAPGAAAIRSELADDEVMIYFATGTEQAYAIVIDGTRARIVALPAVDPRTGAPELAGALRELYTTISGESSRGVAYRPDAPALTPRDPATLRATLHRILVAPLFEHVPAGKRVLIVPDANTIDLPWAALGPADAPWIARNSLRILPGGHLLVDRPRVKHSRRALVLGDPDFRTGAGEGRTRAGAGDVAWQRLPGTRKEAERVAALYRTRALVGNEASEATLRDRAGRAGLIHIASHGVADTARPSYSAIVLADPKRGDDDGLLHAYEIERMQLRAELVVLSACETGVGQVRGSEGMLALDRAFLIAGARAVVSSLWLVDDQATAALFTAFHRERKRGAPTDVALQRAMNEVRGHAKWKDPEYWSAFRVVGAD